MDAAEIDYHRRAGVDIDEDLAFRLAQAMLGPRLSVEVPTDDDRLREWDGTPLSGWPEAPHSFVLEGKKAAFVQLFPVAFSKDGERALTYMDTHCGPMECGLGLLVLLRRQGADWVLEATSMTWQS